MSNLDSSAGIAAGGPEATLERALIGFRISAQRKALGLTQAEFARRLNISPSYLNLIERNKRQIGGVLLQKIAVLLGVETDALTGRAEMRMIAALRDVALEPLLQHIGLAPDLAPDLVGRHPDWSRALLTLYRAWRDQSAIADALSDRLNRDPVFGNAMHQVLSHVTAIRSSSEILDDDAELDDAHRRRFRDIISMESHRLAEVAPVLAGLFDQSGKVFQAATPADEVDDFMLQHNAWFPELERAGDEMRQRWLADGGTDEASLIGYLHARHATTVVPVGADDAGRGGFRNPTRFDPDTRRLAFLVPASGSTRRFQLARHIASVEAAAAIESHLDDSLLTSDTARDRARHALCSYVAAASLFPYEAFLREAAESRCDLEVLCQRHDASFEQICHRLITLRDPRRPGVPFALLRSDPSGFITKRFPLAGLPLPRTGHACPLWTIFHTYRTPDRTLCGVAEFPSGARYLMIARAVTGRPASFHEAPVVRSLMLMCDVVHADRTVYADGLDLSSPRAASAVGITCRTCPRPDCRFRNEEPIVEAGAISR